MGRSATSANEGQGWWEQPRALLVLTLASAVPLLWPDIPPLNDLPGHMGRYKVQLAIGDSESLSRFFRFDWALMGNLGVDLLVMPLAKLFGLELAVKLIVVAIPVMTVAGFLWVAAEVHGRVPPTALFALPLAYSHPFLFGFVNFALSIGMAFLAFGLWLRLGRLGYLRVRAVLFIPISALIWLTHAFGWGVLGVLAFSAELVRQMDREKSLIEAGLWSGCHCLPLTPPLMLMLAWRSGGGVGGETGDWFNLRAKVAWAVTIFRDRWMWLDVASVTVATLLMLEGWRHPKLEFSRNLLASAGCLLLVYLFLPRIVFGSAYADMRLAPYMLAVGLLAIRPRGPAESSVELKIALAGLAFFMVRIAAATTSFYLYDQSYDRELQALQYVPEGARVVSFVGEPCRFTWFAKRLQHLPSIGIVRREAFSNDQWVMPGAQLLSINSEFAGAFASDPSQVVTDGPCDQEEWLSVDDALRTFPRAGFDYVWLIDPPRFDPQLTIDLQPVWQKEGSILFAVQRDR